MSEPTIHPSLQRAADAAARAIFASLAGSDGTGTRVGIETTLAESGLGLADPRLGSLKAFLSKRASHEPIAFERYRAGDFRREYDIARPGASWRTRHSRLFRLLPALERHFRGPARQPGGECRQLHSATRARRSGCLRHGGLHGGRAAILAWRHGRYPIACNRPASPSTMPSRTTGSAPTRCTVMSAANPRGVRSTRSPSTPRDCRTIR